jgi:PAS domain S-box-containing protein
MELQAVQQKLMALRKQYIAQLGSKIEQLHVHWNGICAASGNLEVCPEFQRQLHNMCGVSGNFGCPELGEIATEIENLIYQAGAGKYNLGRTEQQKITDFLHSLSTFAKICEARGANMSSAVVASSEKSRSIAALKPLLYIVSDDADFSCVLTERLNLHFDCRTFSSKNTFAETLAGQFPDAVIMDMMLSAGDLAEAEAAPGEVRAQRVPIVFVSVRDDEESRLAAVRAGAAGYFIKQEDPSRMIALLDQIITRRPAHPYRVLLIDDDVELCQLFQLNFQSVGIHVHVINTAIAATQLIASFAPDLILLDISMPVINGLELGALIRQYPAFNHIPIIYLSASSGEKIHLAAMRLGGDDFLSKPVDPDYLTQLLLARLARVRVTRQGEYRLQEALSELGYIQEGLNQHSIVSIADLAGRITFANARFSEISGYSREELIGQNHRMLKSGQHSPEFYQQLWASISSGQVWNGEITNRRKDGQLYTVLSTIIPILDDLGLPQRYLSIRTDITTISKLNEELDKERARLSLSLEATNTGLWEWNLDLRETNYDDSWYRLLGYAQPSEESWSMLIHPDDHAGVFQKLQPLIYHQSLNYQSEHRKHNAMGGWDWVIETGKVVESDMEGNPVRIVGTMQIINERKQNEAKSAELREQLNQAVKMEAVGHLTAGIAHDFNNILGAMLGYVELSQGLLKNNQMISPEKLDRYLSMIRASGSRAKELIAQMLTFSRLRQGGAEQTQAPVALLTPIVKEVVSLLRSSIPRTVDLNYQIETEGLKTKIQPVHLHQIILNLGINARDAMGEYGKINITLAVQRSDNSICTACNNEFSGDYINITVKDTGSGIPAHILNKIFEPFFTTKEVGMGTGMGLSVVHGLVHALGGHILVDSNAGTGTAISILLPQELELDALTEDAGEDNVVGNIKGAMIMVVDDEQAMATMLHEFLSVYGAYVVSFTDPLVALEAFAQNSGSIDLVITDETMPGMSGMHMSQAMLKLKPGLPVILCTGYSENATALGAEGIGIAAFFRKPLKMNELVKKIEKLLQEKLVLK